MLAKLDVSLQMRLKRRLRSLQGHQHNERRASLARLGDKLPLSSWESSSGNIGSGGGRLVRSVSHSPSRMLAALRSSSQSPGRQPILGTKNSNKFDSTSFSGKSGGPTISQQKNTTASPPRPTHLPLDSFETKFKEKQAKLKLYHKTRPKPDIPLVVPHTLLSPNKQEQSWSTLKSTAPLHKAGLSHSYGDALDVSPETPIASTKPNPYTFKDAVSTPVTPSAPFCTPVKEQNNYETCLKSAMNISLDKLMNPTPETPLPAIPGLPIVPPYLDNNIHSYDQVRLSYFYFYFNNI